jgi:hypothetical protein
MSDTLKYSLKVINNEFENYKEYKDNYAWILQLPLVQELLKRNKKLEKTNEKLIKMLYAKKNSDNSSDSDSESEQNSESIVIHPEESAMIKTYCPIVQEERIICECSLNLSSSDNQPDEEDEVVIISEKIVSVPVKEEPVEEDIEEVEEEETEEIEEEEEEIEEEDIEDVEEETEEVEEEEEEETEEVEEEEEETEEVGEEETEEEEVEEVEEEEESEVEEIVIKGKTYYTSDKQSGVIYDVDENGDISLEVGCFKNGKATFY